MSSNMFLKLTAPDVAGASREPGHAGEIEILSWSHGFAQPGSTVGGHSVEQALHQNLTCTKYVDLASVALLKLCWEGKQIGRAVLSCYRAERGAAPYLTIDMQHVIIANISLSGGPGDMPVENLTFDYGLIKYSFAEQGAAGASATHDLIKKLVS